MCGLCHERVSENATLCPKCFSELRFITKPYCKICGRPFELDVIGEAVCVECLKSPPVFKKARSVMVYDETAKKLILSFKNGDRLDLVPLITKLMKRITSELMDEVDCIIPVPLHRLRLLKRRYNQSAMLARRLAKENRKEYRPDVLKRIRHTPSQGHLTANERHINVRNAFQAVKPERIKGKTILLVDDVLTTGATANECAKVLVKAGAKQIFLLTIASTASLGGEKSTLSM